MSTFIVKLTLLIGCLAAVKCQSPAARIADICKSDNELFIDCADLDEQQKTQLGQFLNSGSGAGGAGAGGIKDVVAFPAMSDVMGLYLRANDIATIAPASFDQLTSLSHLDVSQNGLTDVSFLSGARHHLSLTFLDLSFNRIGSIDAKAFARLHKLRQLKLNNNPIVALDHHAVAAIAKLSKLVVRSKQRTIRSDFQSIGQKSLELVPIFVQILTNFLTNFRPVFDQFLFNLTPFLTIF